MDRTTKTIAALLATMALGALVAGASQASSKKSDQSPILRTVQACAAVGEVCRIGTFEADGVVHPSYEKQCCAGTTCEVSQKTHFPGKPSKYEYKCMKLE